MSQTKVKSGLLNFPDQTDFVKLPSGTTAQRPSSPEKGYSRYNTTDNKLEYWNGTIWQQLPGITPPIITSISYPGDDLAADPDGGQTITITGSDFAPSAAVSIGNTAASVVTFVSATEITFTAPPKTAGDYDVVVTNVDGGNATAVDAITYNGLPLWTTPAGNLGSFPAGSTIPTITLVATEPDSGVVSYSVTTGALPSGLTLSGADIDGTVPSPAGQTTYNFSVTASDDENQESTERAFNIVVYLQVTNTVSEVDPFGDSSGLALYRLENNANDEGGVYNGTWSGTPAYTTGVFGQAANFVGGSTYINTNIDNELQTSVFSYSLWFNASVIDSTPRHLIARYSASAGAAAFWSRVENGKIAIGSYGANGSFLNVEISGINTNTWYNLVVVYNNSDIKYFLNGEKTGTIVSGSATPVNITTVPIILGQINGYIGTYAFNGEIDQVRIFNRSLTPLEVESLYRERTVVCGGQADTLDILVDNSCIATYQLDGNANDLSGNYSGTPTNVSYGVGEFDLAGVFNGSSSNISLPTSIKPANSIMSISLWASNNSTSRTSVFFLEYNNAPAFLALENNYFNDPTALAVYYNNTPVIIPAGSTLPADGSWHHILITASATEVKLYKNGQQIGDTASITVNTNVLTEAHIGVRHYNNDLYWKGSIDQVRIFNKALSSSEVTTLYNETACYALSCSGTTNTLDILSDGSCIAAYPLDGSPADLSGNYNGVQTDVTYPVGKFDLGASFNGSTSAINTIYTPTVANLRTISLWFKCNANQFQVLTSVGPYGVSNNYSWVSIYMLADGKIGGGYAANNGGSVYLKTTTAPYNDNSWHHLALTLNGVYGPGSFVQLYIDGVEVSTTLDTAYSTSLSSIQGTFRIGHSRLGNTSSNAYNVNGSIDQVRIFNKALSAGEVTTLYNETACN